MPEALANTAAVATGGDAGPETLEASVPVATVTLLEDRGLVARQGRLQVPPGRCRLRIEGVAPVLVDKTLAAVLSGPGEGGLPEGVRVRDLKVKRRRITQDADRPATFADLQAKIRDKESERASLEHEQRAIETEAQSLGELEAVTLAEIAEDVGWARQDAARWDAQLEQLATRQRELGDAVCELEQGLRKIDRDLRDLREHAAATQHLDTQATADLLVELVNPTGETVGVQLQIDYVVPGAAWRPWHTARLVEGEDGARVEFVSEGCVWQATGEDWTDVEVVFSTERPSLGVTPPTLQTDRLSAFKRGKAVNVQARDQEVHTAGLGGDEPAKIEAKDELPGIDDGGEALELRGRTRVSIPGDGRPHRVPIFGFSSAAEVSLQCMPELAAAVLLRSRQANGAEHPLLAGPVDLIRDSGLVGRTSLLFIAPGERFDLGWGPEPGLRVTREVEMLDHERRTLSSWTRKPRKITVKLSNIGSEPRTIEVQERIAVSEIEKVEVELVQTVPSAVPDDDGFVTWTVRLKGFGHEALTLTWTLVVHDDVIGL